MIKAEFRFLVKIIDNDFGGNRQNTFFSILRKIYNKVIKLPCVPAKGMTVDLSYFFDEFEFTNEEIELLDENDLVFNICAISLKPKNIVIWLDKNVAY